LGFMNYYLSLGLACFALAIFWRARRFEWIAAVPFAVLTLLAHPIGFLWLVCTLAYIKVREKLAGWRKLAMPVSAASAFAVVYWYTSHRPSLFADWDRGPFYSYNGADQLALYGKRYFFLAGAAFLFGLICIVLDFYARRPESSFWKPFELPFESHGSECRKVGKQFASGDARDRDGAGPSGFTDFIYWAFGRARLHRPLFQLCEL